MRCRLHRTRGPWDATRRPCARHAVSRRGCRRARNVVLRARHISGAGSRVAGRFGRRSRDRVAGWRTRHVVVIHSSLRRLSPAYGGRPRSIRACGVLRPVGRISAEALRWPRNISACGSGRDTIRRHCVPWRRRFISARILRPSISSASAFWPTRETAMRGSRRSHMADGRARKCG